MRMSLFATPALSLNSCLNLLHRYLRNRTAHDLLKIIVIAFVILAGRNGHADDKDGLEQYRRDYSGIKDRLDKAADKQATYLEHNVSFVTDDAKSLLTNIDGSANKLDDLYCARTTSPCRT